MVAKNLKRTYEIKTQCGYQFDPNDLRFDDKRVLIKVVLICHVAGCLGGIVGIAGGIILAPVFL